MAHIEFARGVVEEVVPDVRLTRSPDGSDGTATFYFDNPKALSEDEGVEITGMYMIDEEGELSTREVKGKFLDGRPAGIEAFFAIKSEAEWDRFMRFMNRYAEQNGLGFTKS
ncbi:photosystem II reaction center protein Psb28 [Oscillatoria sp. CS-180]|uniref:photosystem II reaction center protein Psb28 n=1 Tax=Oscillatoria sp. CS-180 TaxID=3021720 RepID=UPI00232B7A6F|nr:photosystem II reaction center protein Psb28 [Oscillatoria sp. CS-180]MDB9527541.1 photosystem II reaction center protein Psb28 [Oscillatoria sp. CS-180]